MKKILCLALVVAIMLTMSVPMVCADEEDYTKTTGTLRIGTASLSSVNYVLGSGIATEVTKRVPGLKVSAVATGGATENMRLMADKEIELSTSNMDAIYNAHFGLADFEGEPNDIMFITSTFNLFYSFAVMANSGITDISQLAGKKICAGPAGSTTVTITRIILEGYGIYDEKNLVLASFNDMPDLLRDGSIDAMIAYGTAGVPSTSLAQLDASTACTMLPMSDEAMDKMIEANPFLSKTVLSKDAMVNMNEDLTLICNQGCIVCDPSIPEDQIYAFLKALYESFDDLQAYHSSAATLTLDNALTAARILPDMATHPGAVKYFKEVGIWDDSLKVG